jgi:peptidoglycan/xylan/chitin deacetylase (PgdA/CDA1 family)
MYHYVRGPIAHLPYFRYLSIENFRNQIRWFLKSFDFPTKDEFFDSCLSGKKWEGTILTFDDGLLDHYQFVLPALKEHGLWGVFFPATGPLQHGRFLDVHRIHLILGRLGPEKAMAALNPLILPHMFLEHDHVNFQNSTYLRQVGDEAAVTFKRMLNYLISDVYKQEILETLMLETFGENGIPSVDNFYMSEEHIKELFSNGMVIGAHSVNHPILSQCDKVTQEAEIFGSCDYLQSLVGDPIILFSYPYGVSTAFTGTTQKILKDRGISMSFVDDPRDITDTDFQFHPLAIPRYDCNLFPFGASSIG